MKDNLWDPIPLVTRNDVIRIIRWDFPGANGDEVLAILDQYTANEPSRVHLAILKVSNGNLEKLRENVAIASKDYRDVICPAEYPQFWKIGLSAASRLSPEDRLQLQQNDWQQYQNWLFHN